MARDRLADVLTRWEPVIGLEIHTELTTLNSKMFCGCMVAFGGEPNTRTCPVCLGLPGALPVPNQAAVESTVLAGLALQCDINRFSQFHRKNYFYPDMPKDYQISQYDLPFCGLGHLDVEVELDGEEYVRRVGVTRIHLEEDTGKMVHVGGSEGRIAGATKSLVDFNRAGTPLMELVTEPDIRHPEEARRFAAKLRQVFLTLGISDVSMEEGSLRVDANVSVRKIGETEFGTKSEVKNMNSFRSLHDALAYEIVRQAELIEDGGRVVQETRHWDAGAKTTSALRSKEQAHDYRYFPEPDMVPFTFTEDWIDSIRAKLPELPDAKKARFLAEYGLPVHDATALIGDKDMAEFYEAAVTIAGRERAKAVSNWMLGELSARLNAEGIPVTDAKVVPAMIAELVELVEDGTISGSQAKEVFGEMWETGDAPGAIVTLRGMKQVSDVGELEAIVDGVIEANPNEVASYRGGKQGLIGFFVGAVMRETKGQANPKVVNEVLRRKLEG